MRLRSKLILAFSIVAIVPLVGGAIGLYAHRDAVRQAAHFRARAADALRQVGATSGTAGEMAQAAASRLEEDALTFATRNQWFETAMGAGTLVGIALGAGFGVVTSFAVTRHIRDIARQIWADTAKVAASASEVAGSGRDLAAASSQQAASLQETSVSLAQVNQTVRTNADHARNAQAISHENRAAAERSTREVAELQAAMRGMSDASASIAQIVHSIDEIAFQTNILALNAAVEAARAGESGAGFSVVAEEVRSLAQRSAQAARETSGKIEDALARSTRGTEIAARVEQLLRTSIAETRRVDDLIARIAGASVEQAKGLEQAVQAMARVEQYTQGNTTSARQAAQVAQQLDAETSLMRRHLSGLIDGAETAGSKPEPARRAQQPRKDRKLATVEAETNS